MSSDLGRARHPPARYAVIGHPVAHSKSPQIHAAFARQTGEDLVYERLLAPLDGFAATVGAFIASGGQGANVTVPFKLEAYALATQRTARATLAGAVNTLKFESGGVVLGDNTDGAGLVRDIARLGVPLADARILLLGAGGAARGVLGPLLEQHPKRVCIVNRTLERATALMRSVDGAKGVLDVLDFAELRAMPQPSFDVILNATSASLEGQAVPVPDRMLGEAQLVYDLMYGPSTQAFLQHARAQGAVRVADGLGMLVEQAAESFWVWRGIRPDTVSVLAALRADLD